MKGYKAFHKDWTCRGFKYEVGKTYELPENQKLSICECGFHFCENPIDVFGYYDYSFDNSIVAEVEALGDIQHEGTKFATNKIMIVKEIAQEKWLELILDANENTGINNTGYLNSGIGNSGDSNSGNHNTGTRNSGNKNSGSNNTGDCNSGNFNIGNFNSGVYNVGSCNCGRFNTGNSNTGNFNSGNYNTGSLNSGNWNTGYFNSGDSNSGIFNTNEPEMRAFNKPTGITYYEFLGSIDYSFRSLLTHIRDNNLDDDDIYKIKALPNFDSDIFKEITGIDI